MVYTLYNSHFLNFVQLESVSSYHLYHQTIKIKQLKRLHSYRKKSVLYTLSKFQIYKSNPYQNSVKKLDVTVISHIKRILYLRF